MAAHQTIPRVYDNLGYADTVVGALPGPAQPPPSQHYAPPNPYWRSEPRISTRHPEWRQTLVFAVLAVAGGVTLAGVTLACMWSY